MALLRQALDDVVQRGQDEEVGSLVEARVALPEPLEDRLVDDDPVHAHARAPVCGACSRRNAS